MVIDTLNGIWVAMGFMRWPLAFSLLAVMLLSMYSVRARARTSSRRLGSTPSSSGAASR